MTELPRAGITRPADTEDWREALVKTAVDAGSRLEVRERAKNPMIPDNFLDFSDSGFPADLVVLPIQVPRQGIPEEMAQYRDMLNMQWLHVPWSAISSNGGQDGKAYVPGAVRLDLGGGNFVASVANQYLMYASREQYMSRRSRNTARSVEALQLKMEERTEDASQRYGQRGNLRFDSTNTGPMTVEEMFEYEKSIGDEPSIKGTRID